MSDETEIETKMEDVAPENVLSEVEQLQAELQETKEKFLRAHAEMENIKKRAQQDITSRTQMAIASFAKDVLTVSDGLERAMSELKKSSETLSEPVKNLITGIEMTHQMLLLTLEKHGITRIESVGKPLD